MFVDSEALNLTKVFSAAVSNCDVSKKEELKGVQSVAKNLLAVEKMRSEISRLMIAEECLSSIVRLMKRLNNVGVFKDDETWFTTFYLYNVCWKFSQNSREYGITLLKSGIQVLLLSNIQHQPYIDNLSKKNVHYLIKASLNILNNILRFPDCRSQLSQSQDVISSLVHFTAREDILAVLSTFCLAFLSCNENIKSTRAFDISLNIKSILLYLKETNGQSKYFSIFEFLEVFRESSFCELQRQCMINLGSFNLFLDYLKSSTDEKVITEVLLIFSNIFVADNKEVLMPLLTEFLNHQSSRVLNAANILVHAISVQEMSILVPNRKTSLSQNILIAFDENDRSSYEIIYKYLVGAELNVIPFNDISSNDINSFMKSAEQVDIVVICASDSLKYSFVAKVGLDYCLKMNKILLPFFIQNKYQPDGWLGRLISGLCDEQLVLNDSKSIEERCGLLIKVVKSHMIPFANEIQNLEISSFNVVDWLKSNNLTTMIEKLEEFDMNMLLYMKKIRKEAPEYFFRSLEQSMHLSFLDVLQFSRALDNL